MVYIINIYIYTLLQFLGTILKILQLLKAMFIRRYGYLKT